MAHPYSTRARLLRLPGRERAAELADRNLDGAEDTDGSVTTIADVLERAANTIDSELAGRYSVPFAAITDSTPTPSIISDWCDKLAVAELILAADPENAQALAWLKVFEEWAKRVRERDAHVPGATEAGSDSTTAQTIWVSDYAQPRFAGRVTEADAAAESASTDYDRQAGA